MASCEEEIEKLTNQIKDTAAKLNEIIETDSEAQKGKENYEAASSAWGEYRAASEEILQLSRANKTQEAAKLMIGAVYEDYTSFAEKLTTLREGFQQRMVTAKPHTFFLHVKASNLMPLIGKFFISVGHFLIYQNTVAFRFHFFHEGVGILPHRRNQHLQSHWSLLPVFRP